ncbi:hypothetical protein PJJ26_08065 [Tenacibaculum finnmarkense]|nr:hypothetical protein PJJ26_08065 [Tenacibaculum finnmarkense]
MNNRQRRRILMSFILTAVGIILYIINSSYIDQRDFIGSSLSYVMLYKGFPMILIITGIGQLLYYYLEVGFKRKEQNNSEFNTSENNLTEKLADFQKQIDSKIKSYKEDKLDSFNLKELVETSISDKIEKGILSDFEKKYSKEAIHQINLKQLNGFSESLEHNLERYIYKLSRNSTINLMIGVLTTIIAVSILGLLVFEKDIDFSNYKDVLSHYLPRISISIFIEVFSFFFLRLYRSNLNDVKYFENERTNIKSKLLALKASYLLNDSESIKSCISNLIETERNFKLKKNESTVELEKSKITSEQDSKWLEVLTNIWNSKK